MRALSLLFDPRSAIDRRTFWSGLLQLIMLSLVVWLGLTRIGFGAAIAAMPLAGEALLIGSASSHGFGSPDMAVTVTTAIALVAARYYVAVCLMLKRSRHAGLGPRPAVVFCVASLLAHALAAAWAWWAQDQDIMVLGPMFADMAANALICATFLVWLGGRPPHLQVKPAS
ncbi:MAG: hypothetical protein J7515_18330 [Caulobacter sp.]|nr:hypothetical protein [Caulobacter sp.]